MDFIEKLNEDGKKGSPTLPPGKYNYIIDIDGTVCEDIPNEEPGRMLTAYEIPDAKEIVNALYEDGHSITFFTARTDAHREYTERWLGDHGFKYHAIIFNKPRGGNYIIIDDKKIDTVLVNGRFSLK